MIVLSLVSTQSIPIALAGTTSSPLNYDNPNQNGNNPYKISLRGVLSAGLLTSVVGCTGLTGVIEKAATKLQTAIIKGINNLLNIKEKVQVSDATTQAKLDSAKFSTDCLSGIAIQLAKNQLTAMTKYTMNWINTGFNGDPLYVQNVNSFMDSITNKILQKETGLFKGTNASIDYPYGRTFAQGAINAQQSVRNFSQSMTQDLTTNYLQPGQTIQDFSQDFAAGGWEGWFGLTQDDKNNPLGSTYRWSQHISDEQATAVQQTTDQINRNGGYIDQQKCVEWQTVDANNQPEYNEDGTEKTSTTGTPTDICIKQQTITPGSTIKDKIATYINSPERQLEMVKTVNDALNALFSALLSKFQKQGLEGLNPSSSSNLFPNGVPIWLSDNNNGGAGNTGGVSGIGGAGGSGGFSASGGSFDLTKDLGNTYDDGKIIKNGVIQIQVNYINDLKKSMDVVDKILPTLGKLDYCIPGPNSNWRNNSADSITAYINSLSTGNPGPIDPATLDQKLNDYQSAIDTTYGSMQDPSSGGGYLAMSPDGLALTKDITTDEENINQAKSDYTDALAQTNSNMAKLKIIKDKVNTIMIAAQDRRNAKRVAAGLPAYKASCLLMERVTYKDGDTIK